MHGTAPQAVQCHAMPCYAMLCCAMLCCAMLCHAMLRYTMLSYAVLCNALQRMKAQAAQASLHEAKKHTRSGSSKGAEQRGRAADRPSPVPDFNSLHAAWESRLANTKAANKAKATKPEVNTCYTAVTCVCTGTALQVLSLDGRFAALKLDGRLKYKTLVVMASSNPLLVCCHNVSLVLLLLMPWNSMWYCRHRPLECL